MSREKYVRSRRLVLRPQLRNGNRGRVGCAGAWRRLGKQVITDLCALATVMEYGTRDQRCDVVGHAIAGRLARADRCAAGARSSLLEDTLAASTSFAGLRPGPGTAGLRGRELVAFVCCAALYCSARCESPR